MKKNACQDIAMTGRMIQHKIMDSRHRGTAGMAGNSGKYGALRLQAEQNQGAADSPE